MVDQRPDISVTDTRSFEPPALQSFPIRFWHDQVSLIVF
jgi:hypothetical protein